ncbi:MAG: glycine--tRNA ligase [Phycisphaerales bacterium]|nr:glycine--tRNA ligase [Phycisphaerales bacterium]
MANEKSIDRMEKIVALCRRRGFIFGSSEIYGGINGFWDYGPLGCELKRNIKDAWWNDMVRNPPMPSADRFPKLAGREFQMVGVDCSIIMNSKVWVASGHVGGFQDPMVVCKVEGCKRLFRADKVYQVGFLNADVLTSMPAAYSKLQDQSISAQARIDVQAQLSISNVIPQLTLTVEADSREQAEQVEPSASQLKRHFGNATIAKVAFPLNNHPPHWPAAVCPNCLNGTLSDPLEFNLMFESNTGALKDSTSKVYLRPETAQGIFANFQNVYDTSRVKIPFGIAQIGKAFRNEINPRNYTFRSREFEQMEIEFFCHPDESMLWYEFWREARINWYKSLGIASDKLRPREQGKEELAHYSSACTDIEYMFPFSDEPQELEGVAHRGSFDLNQHGKFAKGKDDAFAIFDDEAWERDKHLFEQSRDREGAPLGRESAGTASPTSSQRETAGSSGAGDRAKEARSKPPYRYVPHVIEPSAGADRFTLAVLTEAYSYDESRASPEFLKFHPRLAPIKAAVFPLVAKDGLPEIAMPIYEAIRKVFPAQYDAKQSIGKRYARMDEAGTPFCFTIDGQTKVDGTVTVRNRDDASQMRIDKPRVVEFLREQLRI